MKPKLILAIIISLVFSVNLIYAGLTINPSSSDSSDNSHVKITTPTAKTNYTTVNTNSSDYWDNLDTINSTQMSDNGGILTISVSWLSSLFDALYCKLTGCTMTGDLKLQDNVNISDTSDNVRTYFQGGTMYIEG